MFRSNLHEEYKEKKTKSFATDGAPMNTDKEDLNLNSSVSIGAPSVAKLNFFVRHRE
jgi:hypothetical protein